MIAQKSFSLKRLDKLLQTYIKYARVDLSKVGNNNFTHKTTNCNKLYGGITVNNTKANYGWVIDVTAAPSEGGVRIGSIGDKSKHNGKNFFISFEIKSNVAQRVHLDFCDVVGEWVDLTNEYQLVVLNTDNWLHEGGFIDIEHISKVGQITIRNINVTLDRYREFRPHYSDLGYTANDLVLSDDNTLPYMGIYMGNVESADYTDYKWTKLADKTYKLYNSVRTVYATPNRKMRIDVALSVIESFNGKTTTVKSDTDLGVRWRYNTANVFTNVAKSNNNGNALFRIIQFNVDYTDNIAQIYIELYKGDDILDTLIIPIVVKNEAVFDIDSKLNTISATVSGQSGHLSTIQQKMDSITSTVENTKGEISNIKQSVDNISLKVKETGIDIENNKITLNGTNTTINGNLQLKNSNDGLTIYNGENPSIEIMSDSIGVVNYDAATATYTNSSNSNSFYHLGRGYEDTNGSYVIHLDKPTTSSKNLVDEYNKIYNVIPNIGRREKDEVITFSDFNFSIKTNWGYGTNYDFHSIGRDDSITYNLYIIENYGSYIANKLRFVATIKTDKFSHYLSNPNDVNSKQHNTRDTTPFTYRIVEAGYYIVIPTIKIKHDNRYIYFYNGASVAKKMVGGDSPLNCLFSYKYSKRTTDNSCFTKIANDGYYCKLGNKGVVSYNTEGITFKYGNNRLRINDAGVRYYGISKGGTECWIPNKRSIKIVGVSEVVKDNKYIHTIDNDTDIIFTKDVDKAIQIKIPTTEAIDGRTFSVRKVQNESVEMYFENGNIMSNGSVNYKSNPFSIGSNLINYTYCEELDCWIESI